MEDLFDMAMKELRQKETKPTDENKCKHERTFLWHGWKACVKCGLCLHKVYSQNPYSNVAGYDFSTPKKDRFPKFRETLFKMMCAISRNGCIENGKMIYYEPPNPELLPIEILDHLKELSWKCMDQNVKCHRRSLCAAILWKKVKYSYPKVLTLEKFSEKVGVSIPTIIGTCKKII